MVNSDTNPSGLLDACSGINHHIQITPTPTRPRHFLTPGSCLLLKPFLRLSYTNQTSMAVLAFLWLHSPGPQKHQHPPRPQQTHPVGTIKPIKAYRSRMRLSLSFMETISVSSTYMMVNDRLHVTQIRKGIVMQGCNSNIYLATTTIVFQGYSCYV